LISKPLSLMKLELEPTDNFSIQSNSSLERKMPPTTSPEDITPLVKKSLIFAWTESENSLITVLDSKDSWSSTPSEVVQDQVWAHSCWKDSQLITARNPNSVSLSILPPKSPLQLLNLTTPSYPPTHYWNTLMWLLCWITKPSTIFAEDNWILKDPLTPT
jgi:hypothetical protein